MSKILDSVINDIKNGKSIDFTQTDFTYEKYFDELREKFLENFDDNNTYLDYILEGVKTGILITEIDRLISYFEDPEKIAEFYLILAKHDMISYIKKLGPMFLVSLIAILLNVFILTRVFWFNIPWWIYILVIGITLVLFAVRNETKEKNDSMKKKLDDIKDKLNL